MIFEFDPWKLDIDVKATEALYAQNDFATDKSVNETFVNAFTKEQKAFFRSVGVNPMRARAEEKSMIYRTRMRCREERFA